MFARGLLPIFSVVLLLGVSGCAVVQTRITDKGRGEIRAVRKIAQPNCSVQQELEAACKANKQSAQEELAAWLRAAQVAYPGALRDEPIAAAQYRAALRQVIALQERNDWKLSPQGSANFPIRFELKEDFRGALAPTAPDVLLPADQLKIRGLPERKIQSGFGLPMVAWFRSGSDFLQGEPGVSASGMAIPVTATLTFVQSRGKTVAEMRFTRTLVREVLQQGKRKVALAADFSAPLAYLIARGQNRDIDLFSLFRPLQQMDRSGLVQLQPFDPEKIPVVFVHGLLSRPETWRAAVNYLQSDPEIRKKYQFWFFSYPTGLPVWVSAQRLREELDRFNSVFLARNLSISQQRKLQQKILVGHSMGGLLSSLQIRRGGNHLWRQFSDTNLEELAIPDETRKEMLRVLDFQPRSDIRRVIFVAVPHRGSPTALKPISNFFANKIRFYIPEIERMRPHLLTKLNESARRELAAPANSIRFLRANSPLLESILKLPIAPQVHLHTILGDRGRGDGEAGSDGIVPYWSTHLPAAVSEKIVPSGHGAHEHPEGIQEIARILVE